MSTLIELRNEVLAHGFDVGQVLTLDDVTRYLNIALRRVARKIDFYAEESSQAFATVAGTAAYAWPTDLGRMRYLRLVDDAVVLTPTRLREVDSSAASTGKPRLYALSGAGVMLYPTPDAAYNMMLRYYALPALMVADTDVPAIPEDYHSSLTFYAIQRCYEREDDAQMGQYWEGRWLAALADMRADVKFPSADGPRRIDSMWPTEPSMPQFVLP